jgi:hypothetical protein
MSVNARLPVSSHAVTGLESRGDRSGRPNIVQDTRGPPHASPPVSQGIISVAPWETVRGVVIPVES